MRFSDNKPIYLQIKERLLRKIFSGEYFAGYKLPSIRDLALQMEVNAKTVVQAYDELGKSGLIYTDSTNGKYITTDQKKLAEEKRRYLALLTDEFLFSVRELGLSKDQIKEIIDGKDF